MAQTSNMIRPRPGLAIPLAVVIAMLSACEDEPERPPTVEVAPTTEEPGEPVDAGVDAAHDAGPPRPPARLFAKRFVTKIRVRPDRDAFRVGYLRAGAVIMATTGDPVRADDPRCRGGWYELTTGGFVCNGRDVIAFWGRRLPQAQGAQPDRAAPLPYDYGRTRGSDTPMYRNLPTDEQAVEYEGFRIPGQAAPDEATAEGAPSVSAPSIGAPSAGATSETTASPATAAPSPTASPAAAAPAQPAAAAPAVAPAGLDAGVAPVTLATLQGERDSILMRRMVSGFIVSLDRDFRAGSYGRRYWRTINNGFVPYRRLAAVSYPDFQGGRVDDVRQLPIGYILWRNETFYLRSGDDRARRGGAVDFHHRLNIVGEVELGNTVYYEAADGRLYRERDVRRIEPHARPAEVGPRDKWIEVNLSDQYVIAYEGDVPVYVTLTSTGRARAPNDPEADYLTPTGVFRVRAKHLASTMDGDTAGDGPYSIDDVPWVMYFQLAYALHGAFWHRAFGFPRSHGCVNLAPRDAQWIFNWSDPQLPVGWHGVYPTEEAPGTWIWIHGQTPGSN